MMGALSHNVYILLEARGSHTRLGLSPDTESLPCFFFQSQRGHSWEDDDGGQVDWSWALLHSQSQVLGGRNVALFFNTFSVNQFRLTTLELDLMFLVRIERSFLLL